MSKIVIGLTGGIGSGKTTVANIFAEYGIDIVDADVVARQVVEPGTPALAAISDHFGADFILADGSLDRAKLRQKIFSNPTDKQWLNSLLHPLIRETMHQQCLQAKSAYCFLVAPLLIENGIHKAVDKVLVVDVMPETQIARTIARDNNTAEQVEKILAAQVSRETRLAHADFVLYNDSNNDSDNNNIEPNNNNKSTATLKEQIELLHRQFLKLVVAAR